MGTRNLLFIALLAAAFGLGACNATSGKVKEPSVFSEGHAITQGQSGGH